MAGAKGEVVFSTEAAPYRLVFDFNAICALEDEFDVEASKIGDVVGARAKNIRKVFRIGLSRHHPAMTDTEAGDIISEISPQKAGELITEAFKKAFPEAVKDTARPPKPAKNGVS